MRVNASSAVIYLDRTGSAQAPKVLSAAQVAGGPVTIKLENTAAAPKAPKTWTAAQATGDEPVPTRPTPGQTAMANAMNRNLDKALADLRTTRQASGGAFETRQWVQQTKERVPGKPQYGTVTAWGWATVPTELGKFAHGMAQALGISEADARLLTDAMSRGGYDAKTLGAGIDALRSMSADERAQWLPGWLETAKGAAEAIVRIDSDPAMRWLGSTEADATKLGDFAAVNELMVGRNKPPPPNMTREEVAEKARKAVTDRVAHSHSAGALLAQTAMIGKDGNGPVDVGLRDDFARYLAGRYSLSLGDAQKLIDAMRNGTQVGPMIAEGLNRLENMRPAERQAFAASFFRTAVAATDAETAILADVFQREFGAVNDDNVKPIGDLADFLAALAEVQKRAATQALAVGA